MDYIFGKLAIGTRLSRLGLYWSIVILICSLPVQAQPPSSGQVVLKATDHLALYRVDSDGELTLLADLPNTFGIRYIPNAEWNIPSWKQVVMSPNGAYLAFVADRSLPSETALFLYSLSLKSLKQVHLPTGFGAIHWSPASNGIIIAPFEEYYDNSAINSIYLYDLPADRLTELVDESGIFNGSILWMPDSQHVIYVGSLVPCEQPCVTAANLFVIGRDGKHRSALTDLGTQIPKNTTTIYDYCAPRQIIWNDEQQRIYYSLICTDETERYLDMLYSVTLKQDNRFEGDLRSLFPLDTESVVLKIIPIGNTVYIANNALSKPYINNSETGYSALRILQLDHPRLPDIVNEFIYDSEVSRVLITAKASPDNHYLAFVGYSGGNNIDKGYIKIVDINSGRLEIEPKVSEQICTIQWLDNQHIIYTQFPDSQCNPYTQPGDTVIYDLQAKSAHTLNQAGEKLWLLQPPDIP